MHRNQSARQLWYWLLLKMFFSSNITSYATIELVAGPIMLQIWFTHLYLLPPNGVSTIVYITEGDYNIMTERKPWTQQQDSLLLELTQDPRFGTVQKLRWGDIAEQLSAIGSKRSGKQCRERWHNQLKPGIDNDRDWSPEEEKILFREQEAHGNRWALIAKALPGRTDNNIKNFFYSTLRKALRKVNAYVSAHKKEPRNRNIKEFKPQNLNKILAVAESKYEQKINLKSSRVVNDAKRLKKMLIQIQLDSSIGPTQEKCQILSKTVEQVLQFNRNCKRRKGKKKDSDNWQEAASSYEISQMNKVDQEKYVQPKRGQTSKANGEKKQHKDLVRNDNKKAKQAQKQDKVKLEEIQPAEQQFMHHNNADIKQSKSMLDSGKLSAEKAVVVRSQSSGLSVSVPSFFESSSSFNRCPTGPMMLDGLSHQYSKTQHFTRGLNILDSMPMYEARRTDEINGSIFLRENPPSFNSIRLCDQSREVLQEDAFRISTLLGRKMTSRYSKNQDIDE